VARLPLSRDRIVSAAMELADEKGVAGVTMRAVAGRLGVEAMSLYNHVSGREALLDGMVDAVFAEIALPAPGTAWKQAMRERAASSRAALLRHRWAVGLMDSRKEPGPATLRHHDAVLGVLRTNGFSVAMAAHAFSAIDSYVYGYLLQELSLPFASRPELDEVAGDIQRDLSPDAYPHLAEMVEYALKPEYDHADEFEFGLALILDALRPDEFAASPGSTPDD
jgi:AcrR family transcriptional regulator